MNILGDQKVCFGTAKRNIPAITSLQEIMKEYERVFWSSEFTDSGSTTYLALWRKLSREKTKVFPIKELKSYTRNLKHLFK